MGKQYTKYASYFVAHSDSTYKPKMIKNSRGESGIAQRTYGGKFPSRWSEYQFDEIYIKDGQLTEYAIMPMNLDRECCQYTEPVPKQQWTLKDEQQTIGGSGLDRTSYTAFNAARGSLAACLDSS